MARDFPDIGQSPIDAYLDYVTRPCAFFEARARDAVTADPAMGIYVKCQDRSSVSQTAVQINFDLHSTASKAATQYVQGQIINMYVQSDVHVAAGLRVNAFTRDKYVGDTNPTITQFFGIDVQLDDMGNDVGYIAGISIDRTVVDKGTAMDTLLRLNANGADSCIAVGSGTATYALDFVGLAIPCSSSASDGTTTYHIACRINNVACWINAKT